MNGGIIIVACICIDLRVRPDVISMAKVLYSPGNLLAMVSAALNQTLIWQGNANDKATDAGFAHVLGTSNSVRIILPNSGRAVMAECMSSHFVFNIYSYFQFNAENSVFFLERRAT